MKPDENLYEWIDGYLNGELNDEALSAFMHKLESDKEFSALLQNQKAANDIILGNRLMQVKQMMDADFKAADNKHKTGRWRLGGLLGTAAIVGSLLYLSNKTALTKSFVDTNTGTQQSIPHTAPSDLHKEAPVHKQQQYKNKSAQTQAVTDTATTNLLLPGTHSGVEISAFYEIKKPNNLHQTTIDSVLIKNQLPGIYKTTEKTDLCKDVVIEGILRVDAACLHKNDGEITIIEGSVKGGQSPYTFGLVNQATDTLRQKTRSFTYLAAGQYNLFFEDANNCICAYKKPLNINEKSCNTPTQSFSPHAGEYFTYPVSGEQDANITLYNRAGQLVYKARLSKGESGSWDGTNQNGQLLSTGVYIYIIEYLSGTKETGEVVIF